VTCIDLRAPGRTGSLKIGPAPMLTIRIELERSEPLIGTFCANKSETTRLVDWLEHQPELRGLVERAAGLRRAEQP
jgi:hypothetical protein